MALVVEIKMTEEASKKYPYKRIYTETYIGIPPEEAYNYIEQEVLDVPEKRYSSTKEYYKECWGYTGCNDDSLYEKDLKLIKSTMKFYNSRFEFWVEEKTGESLRNWLSDSSSHLFTIVFENIEISLRKED